MEAHLPTYPPELMNLLEACSLHPQDTSYRLVAADWAEENNFDYLAECLRWMTNENKYPCIYVTRYSWWNEGHHYCPNTSLIPQAVLTTSTYDTYESPLEAEWALYSEWERARRRGWIIPG